MATDFRAPAGPWAMTGVNQGHMYRNSCLNTPAKCEAQCTPFSATFDAIPDGYVIANPDGTFVGNPGGSGPNGLGAWRC